MVRWENVNDDLEGLVVIWWVTELDREWLDR